MDITLAVLMHFGGFRLIIKELSGIQIGNWQMVYFIFIALTNLINTSWMYLYQIDLSSNKEFHNVLIFLISRAYNTIYKFLNKMFKKFCTFNW